MLKSDVLVKTTIFRTKQKVMLWPDFEALKIPWQRNFPAAWPHEDLESLRTLVPVFCSWSSFTSCFFLTRWPDICHFDSPLLLFYHHTLFHYAYVFQYKDGDEVVLWMNTVGPYHNRQETYSYFSLPFCRGQKSGISHYHETLGEALLGVELEFSGIDIDFKGLYVCLRVVRVAHQMFALLLEVM